MTSIKEHFCSSKPKGLRTFAKGKGKRFLDKKKNPTNSTLSTHSLKLPSFQRRRRESVISLVATKKVFFATNLFVFSLIGNHCNSVFILPDSKEESEILLKQRKTSFGIETITFKECNENLALIAHQVIQGTRSIRAWGIPFNL